MHLRSMVFAFTAVIALGCARGPTPSVVSPVASLADASRRRVAAVPGAEVGVAFRDLATGDTLFLGADEDRTAVPRGLNNTPTARDLPLLLTTIETKAAASRASSDSMRAILRRQEFNDEIPAGLPPGTPVAHKTGSITGHLHDAAIIYPQRRGPYVLVVLTRGIDDEKVARSLIADIPRPV